MIIDNFLLYFTTFAKVKRKSIAFSFILQMNFIHFNVGKKAITKLILNLI